MTADQLKQLYEQETGQTWSGEPGAAWLMQRDEVGIYSKVPVLSKSAHITLSDKIGWLSQQFCRVCNPDCPISTIPLRIRPESWQAIDSVDKTAFKAAIASRLKNSPHITAQDGRICLSFVFVCSANRRTRDLDNMAKLVMDSIKGIVMGDDRDVDHLNLMRVVHEGAEEFVYFRISNSHINDHNDVAYPQLRHTWGVGEPLQIEDFRATS